MQIKRLKVENFKSFNKLDINFSEFNVLIGPNAAGKSNFISIFKFIKDIINIGLENAISLHGGIDYIRNINLANQSTCTSILFKINNFSHIRSVKKIKESIIRIRPISFIANFTIEYLDNLSDFRIISDNLIQEFEFYEINNEKDTNIGTGILELNQNYDKIIINFINNTTHDITKDDIIPALFIDINSLSQNVTKTLFIENQYYIPHPESARKALGNLCIYDLDSIQSRSVSSIIGKAELEENGENIAIVLKRILNNEDTKRQLFNYIKYVLPFVEDIEVDNFLDKHLQIKVKEKYISDEFIPASILSSGSILLISIIIALFFENKYFAIFEEVGGHVHPYLISRIIDMMKEASSNKQIFLTTHNPEIVKYAGLEHIYYLSRDKFGFSIINKLSNKAEIHEFLKNEIGIEELYIQNLLN